MVNSSDSLKWMLMRKHTSFLIKRNGITLSKEPRNLKNIHSFKYSGLANSKSIGIEREGNKIAVRKTRKVNRNRPTKSTTRHLIKKHQVNHSNRGTRAVKSVTGRAFFRRDLTQDAVARYHALHKASKRAEASAKAKQVDEE
eukprot:7549_1